MKLLIALATALGFAAHADTVIGARTEVFGDVSAWMVLPEPQLKAGEPRRRLFWFHGLFRDHQQALEPPYAELFSRLTKQGWQVVLLDLPDANAIPALSAQLLGDGAIYRLAWKRMLSTVQMGCEQRFGHATVQVVAGTSWGGLHALMGAALVPGFTAYAALMPVTRIQALDEFRAISAARFDPFAEISYLANIKGYVAWGDQDARVDFRLIRELTRKIKDGGVLETREYPGLDHDMKPAALKDFEAWLMGIK